MCSVGVVEVSVCSVGVMKGQCLISWCRGLCPQLV